jgi:hypothetical protein
MVSAPEIDIARNRQSATGRWFTVVLLTMEERPGQAAEVLMLKRLERLRGLAGVGTVVRACSLAARAD